jgi:hypothetical protein
VKIEYRPDKRSIACAYRRIAQYVVDGMLPHGFKTPCLPQILLRWADDAERGWDEADVELPTDVNLTEPSMLTARL